MNKTMRQRLVAAVASIGCIAGSAQAYEIRSPWLSERGPLSYIFENEKEDRYSLNVWHAVHTRCAQKAFKEHGTKTEPLTSLMFGKADFRISEILPDSHADMKTEFYSPAVRLATLHPRAQYNEKGVTLGGRFEYPVYEDKGRIGLRVSVPFRCIEIEREDWTGVPDDADTNAVIKQGFVKSEADTEEAQSFAMRLDAFESIVQSINGNAYLDNRENELKAGGDKISMAAPAEDELVFVYSKKDGLPSFEPGTIAAHVANDADKFKVFDPTLPVQENVYYYFSDANGYLEKYTALLEASTKTVNQRLKDQKLKEHLWLVKVWSDAGIGEETPLDIAMRLYEQQSRTAGNEYMWLYQNGVDFKSERRSGLGDIDLDIFYEHRFTNELLAEVMLGVRIPVGGSSRTTGNPYRPRLGNGSHAEVKLGAMLAYQPLEWMNMKLDMYYSFAIEAIEHRAAAFTGAQVRHLGPEADAKVDWGYFVGRLDFNFFHPETKSLSSLLGYEVFVKQKDHVRFKKSQMQSWLGRKLNADGTEYIENLAKLDNCVAEKDTDAIAHKVRGEASYRVNKYFELFLGGSYTFAGKNVPQETDCHGGFRVQF